ncbi:PBP1b-binding outer membrane lipoprotein LpoB [Sphingomonas sp. BE270]|jgi:hypothetical protein|uniref:hypothetical protein n=1 Tax=unclassified Sphingomonas TaxID=196159 RepID=UPI000A71BBED|nr:MULTISPECIES: hypothetical protein [unclassified Sphingomonas]MDR6847823.1 PBP1b-binding outer membrane lipoprotein LpoB [Sphingomonas sp. BE137]MDR7258497.1 PBP1b-binding outer membrane lipoprotein LpoB [Sphingomonas sp. BE270]RUN78526.1 hypothetical protein EJC47_01255 [Sphingomonas sp. TF3]
MRKIALILSVSGLALGLAGCSGYNAPTPTPTPTPTPSPAFQEQFGTGFNSAFQASPNATPAAVKPGDIIPVDPAATPQTLPK